MSRDTNGSTTVCNTRTELADVAGLVTTGQTQFIVLAINSDVLVVPLGKLLDSSVDGLHASWLTHSLGAVVGVATGTVPLALKGLGVERHLDAPLLGNADQEEACHPEVVTHFDALARTYLELPLRGHDFSIDTTDVDASIETCTVVCFDQITGKDSTGTCAKKIELMAIEEWQIFYLHRSSRDLAGQGNRSSASRKERRLHREGCTPARDRTKGLCPWLAP